MQLYIKKRIKILLKEFDKLFIYPIFYPLHAFTMTPSEVELFDKIINNSNNYLEFGLGGSTIRALLKSNAMVYSVESSIDWIEEIRKYRFIRNMEKTRLKLLHAKIGETKKWGNPVGGNNKNQFQLYSSLIFKQHKNVNFDTILIDGRFRVACALKTILECDSDTFPNIKILIHDFPRRDQYHILLNYLDEIERADSLVLFHIKNDIDLDTVKANYEIYKNNPM